MPCPVSCLFAGLALVYLGLKPEFTLSDYFVTIRNLAVVFSMSSIIEYLFISTDVPSPASSQNLVVPPEYKDVSELNQELP
jgi:hypothetical protein